MIINVSTIAVIGVVSLTVGTAFHVLGTVTNQWTSVAFPRSPRVTHGLFQECTNGQCKEIGEDFRFDKKALSAVGAFSVVGVVASVMATLVCVLTLVMLFVARIPRHRTNLVAGSVTLASVAAACILTALVLHALVVFQSFNGIYTHLSTSFVYSCVGGILLFLGAIVFGVGARLVIKEQDDCVSLPTRIYYRKRTSLLPAIFVP